MSKDIRSFFSVVSKKKAGPAKKQPVVLDSSDDEVIPDTPDQRKPAQSNKRKTADSSFEDDHKRRKKKANGKVGERMKPVDVNSVFSSAPAKQSKVEKPAEPDLFEQTLQQLDDDFPIDVDELDRSIAEAEKKHGDGEKKHGDGEKKHGDGEKKYGDGEKKHSDGEKKKSPKKSSSSNEGVTPNKKRKPNDHNDSGIDPDQERHERKRQSYIMYQKYLNRSGPAHKGEKEMPKGKPDCLKNLCFMKTGVLDSMDKDDIDALVKEHGGRTVSAVSRKVNYIIVGEDPGPAKIEKAKGLGIKQITEDELLDMILVKSGMAPKYCKGSSEHEQVDTPSTEIKKESRASTSSNKPNLKALSKSVESKPKSSPKKTLSPSPKKKSPEKTEKVDEVTKEKIVSKKAESTPLSMKQAKVPPISNVEKVQISDECKSWTEKYKPTSVKSIIGQQGDKSNMSRLTVWLSNWYKNHAGKNRPKLTRPSPWAKNDDGAFFKCALLSGPPGVGKTTTATLVAAELGFDVVEFNASDTRSKRLLREEVSQLLKSTSLASYFKDGSAPTRKHVLLMDEVDGMAGNEDRGGMQELIALIKETNVPIICMCNDRQHQKMRSLVNYCLDLRFTKPRLEQIKGAMMSICFKEGVKISGDALNEIIKATGMDIRQTLNNLSMWSAGNKNLSSDLVQKESEAARKDTVLGPWEVIRKVFSEEEHKGMTLNDKSRLFFFDYSLGPLFVQENYLQVVPHCPKKQVLERVAAAADAISMGDVIDKKIRSSNNWALLESQAMFSSVLPGHYMEGHFGGQINFPGWLGKNSKRTKFQRLLSEIQAHMRTSISGSKLAVNLDYIYLLRNLIARPLVREGVAGVDKAVEILRAYNLLKEDFDSMLELSHWPKQKDPMAMVESKVKAAFTRTYNKSGPALPYSMSGANIKKKAAAAVQEDDVYGDEAVVESDGDDDDDISKDAMIKEKKKAAPKGKKTESETTKKASTSKAKGRKPK